MRLFKKNTSKRVGVLVSQCVHFCGFRYGHGDYHPYETYVRRLHRKEEIKLIRDQFVDFLLYYRPRHLGQALGVTLSRDYPLWLYPWDSRLRFWWINKTFGWYDHPKDIPDIMTHFSEAGIPGELLANEFQWLEGAYESISRQGYLPDLYGYPKGKLFRGSNNAIACLLLDGNHRVSALSALGYDSLDVEIFSNDEVSIAEIDKWPGIKNGYFTKEDSVKIFNAYLLGNSNYKTTDCLVASIFE